MKKLICITLIIAAFLTSCGTPVGGRFQYIRTERTSDGCEYKLYVDTDTGVMYWNMMGTVYGRYSGLTVLFDTDGQPLLWNGQTEVE